VRRSFWARVGSLSKSLMQVDGLIGVETSGKKTGNDEKAIRRFIRSLTTKQKGQATAKADPCGMTTNRMTTNRTGNSKTLIFSSACEAVNSRNNYGPAFGAILRRPLREGRRGLRG
jgi:hypothetical protein